MNTTSNRTHAIVIGASIAGLLAARVLSDHFARVTILERDQVSSGPSSRKGQPQTRHLHALLASGLLVMCDFFPGLTGALEEHGALVADGAENMNFFAAGNYRTRFHFGHDLAFMTRPMLEQLIRERVMALPNVLLRDQCAVPGLLASADRSRVSGAIVQGRGNEKLREELAADLVIDCTGRGSRASSWLQKLGFEAPVESEVLVNVRYATQQFRRDPSDSQSQDYYILTPEGESQTRFAALFPVEGHRWLLTVGDLGGKPVPEDGESVLEFIRTLPAPEIYDLIRKAAPLSDVLHYNLRSSLRRHYEKLRRFPAGLLVIGDAVCSFNPVYGQGMSVAALEAQALDSLLADPALSEQPVGPRLAFSFFRKAAKVIDNPWMMAVTSDFRFSTTTGPKPFAADLINGYMQRVDLATHHDPVVGMALLRVIGLLEPPSSLFHPKILWRVLFGRRTKPAPTPRFEQARQAGGQASQ